jgi:Phosphotransferase enzyme family
MSSFDLDSGRAGSDDKELRRSIEQALAQVRASESPLTAVRRRGCPESSSYTVEVVTVELATGEAIDILLKDFGRSRLPKDAMAERRERELRVYAELLDGAELGSARFYGARWDDAAAHFWLLLEFVDGDPLRDCSFEHWLAAAAWLGRMHGRFAGQRAWLQRCGFLLRHDADFFVDKAERALRAVSALSGMLAQRLAAVLDGYNSVLAVLTRDPETLVHGSYRPHNVLVVRSSEPPRICPTDWELAAFGRPAYDLAFLCDGFRPSRLDALFDAYGHETERSGAPGNGKDELRYEVDCFRLHKAISSLGHSHQWKHPAETAAKVLATAEELAETLA